jgi:hypothetical protein
VDIVEDVCAGVRDGRQREGQAGQHLFGQDARSNAALRAPESEDGRLDGFTSIVRIPAAAFVDVHGRRAAGRAGRPGVKDGGGVVKIALDSAGKGHYSRNLPWQVWLWVLQSNRTLRGL